MCVEVINGMADTIADLERKLAEREWIPVSERLPENNGRYLVCYKGIVGMRTNILHYGVPSPLHTRGTEKCFYDVDREYGDVPYDDIVAWQPLPEPYKGGDTE